MTFSHIFASIHRSLRTVGLSFFGLILLSAWLVPVQSVTAITDLNLHAILYNTQHFNGACADQATDGAQSPRVSDEEVKKAYLIGDSKGFHLQTKGTIEDKFRNNNWQLTRNAVPGRSYSSGGANFPGAPPAQTIADALSADATTIQQADAIIIELGTNPPTVESNFTTKLRNLVGDLKDLNPDANYYYVDIGATANPNEYSRRNRIIHDEAASLGYKVISEYKNNFGNSADPKNIPGPDSVTSRTDTSPPADTNDYLEGDFIHNTDAGAVSLAELIATEVTGSSGSTPADTAANADGNCVCSALGSNLPPGTLPTGPNGVPEPYNSIFTAAGTKFNVEPALIAGIFHYGEHGGSNGAGWPNANGPWASSPVGASGPFQFMPKTWGSYGVDGDNNGVADIQNLTDAAFGAANYLAANGGIVGAPLGDPHGGAQAHSISNAIWHYNHADWYVDNVLQGYWLYGGVAGNPGVAPSAGGGATPAASNTNGCPGATASGQFQWPVEPAGTLTACWGDVRSYGRHSGLDIGVPVGSKVFAADAGTVEFAGVSGSLTSGYGNAIVINHGNGFWTLYGHLSEILVAEGDTVTKGQEIAKSGNTGRSTGAHLHFNVQKQGGVQGSANGTVNPLTNGVVVPDGVGSATLCDDFPDGGRGSSL